MKDLPTIALIGAPNVGKSTLFNMLLGERKAIVSEIAGTTRDRIVSKVVPRDQFGNDEELISHWLVDTAGLTNNEGADLEDDMRQQTEMAIESAEVIVFMVDGKRELSPDDEAIGAMLRKTNKPVILLANKLDDGNDHAIYDLTKLGLGMPVGMSAKNFYNFWEFQDQLQQALKDLDYQPNFYDEDDGRIRFALLGRPNVGKSTLFNQLTETSRAVVSEISGTTRDTIDYDFTDSENTEFTIVDSAGLRRPGKIGSKNIEFWSSVRTSQAIERTDVCVVLIDAMEGLTHQDMAIIGKVLEAGKGLIIGVNKFDLVRSQTQKVELKDYDIDQEVVKMWGEDLAVVRQNFLAYLKRKLEFVPWAPVIFFSGKTGRGVKEILPAVKGIYEERQKRLETADLNRWVPEVYYGHVAPSVGNKVGKIKYVSQVDTCPPKFLVFVNNTQAFHFSYKRYLENKLREKHGFFGTPITIEFRDQMQRHREKHGLDE